MSAQGPSSPPTDGARGQGSSSLPLAPPLQTSLQEPTLSGDVGSSRGGLEGSSAQAGEQAGTGLSGEAANDTSDNVERSDKRSLTGRKRGGSTGSKRSAQLNEKTARPSSAGRTQAGAQPRTKKKKGLLAFLNCCSSPDESQELASSETAQPAKTPAVQPTRSRAPQQQQNTQTQSTSVTNASTEDSKEIIDEKAAPNSTTTAEPILPAPVATEKQMQTGDSAVSDLPTNSQAPLNFNPGGQSVGAEQPLQTDMPSTTLPPAIDTSNNPSHDASNMAANPNVIVEAPTPVVPPTSEEELITDRTPEQQQRDTDIEMTDAGPSLPLSTNEVAPMPESETREAPRRESESSSRVDLPPPPPLDQRQAQVGAAGLAAAGAGAGVLAASHDTSLASSPDQSQKWLLPALKPEMRGRKCLVLDLDETLVHSSFKILHQADMTIPVEIEGQYHNVYVIKRPGVDTFLKRMGELYEVVVFTASVSKYGDPLLDQLDISHSVHHRLFRESCYNHQGNYVKDLSQVGRRLEETIIIDNSPTSYIFHPQHAVPISSWFSDAHDNELLDLIPVLEDLAGEKVRDVSLVLDVAL